MKHEEEQIIRNQHQIAQEGRNQWAIRSLFLITLFLKSSMSLHFQETLDSLLVLIFAKSLYLRYHSIKHSD